MEVEEIICSNCGEKMEFKDSLIEKKTETVSIEVMIYKCENCGNKEVREVTL